MSIRLIKVVMPPAKAVPEISAQGPGHAGTGIIREQIQRRSLSFSSPGAATNPATRYGVRSKETAGNEDHTGENGPYRSKRRDQDPCQHHRGGSNQHRAAAVNGGQCASFR